MLESDAIIADEVLRELRRQLADCQPISGEIATLMYWSRFQQPDGTDTEGFTPGYTVGPMKGPPGERWVVLRLPDGTRLPFWPRFVEHKAPRLVMTIASSFGTFALAPAD